MSERAAGPRLLVPISRTRHVEQLLKVANAVAGDRGGGQLLGVVEIVAHGAS